MIIRDADFETDALEIVEGARDFISRTEFQGMISEDVTEAVSRIVTLPGVEIILAEDNGIVGGLGLLFTPFLWNKDLLVADELFWWTSKDAPFRTGHLLFKESMAKIDRRGAVPFFRALSTSPRGVDRMYRKQGLTPFETAYARF